MKYKLLDDKIEALIYELCPNTSRAWIFDEGIPEKLRILIGNAKLDEAILAVNNEMNQTVGSKAHAIRAINNLRGARKVSENESRMNRMSYDEWSGGDKG